MSKKLETTIHGLKVELEIDMDDEPSTQCFVESRDGRYSASLGCLVGEGYLIQHNAPYGEKMVSERAITKIEAWAEENGY